MTYSQLLHDLAQINLHPLADTNVLAVTNDRGAAILEFDSEEEALKAELKEADKRLVASEQETNDMEARALKAEELLDEMEAELKELRRRKSKPKSV